MDLPQCDAVTEPRRVGKRLQAAAASDCLQQVIGALDYAVGFAIGGFKFAVWPVRRVGFVMVAAVDEGPSEALVEEEQECDGDALGGQTVR